MVIFLFVPVQENLSGEIPPSYCIGTIPSNGSYDSEDIKNWSRKIYRLGIKHKFKLLGVAADNYSSHQSVWRELMFSSNPHYSFLRTTYTLFEKEECVLFCDPPHILRNWLYNLQNMKKIMRLGIYPVIYEDLIELRNYTTFNSNYLNVKKKMNQDSAEFFFSKKTIESLSLFEYENSQGLRLYLIYGHKFWVSLTDRNIGMEERLFLASEVISFILLWWYNIGLLGNRKDNKHLIMTKNTMNATLQACFSLFIINFLFKDAKEIPLCTWKCSSQP